MNGKVWLVGAGPGDFNLLTLRAKQVIEQAEVVVYDALVSAEILAMLPDQARKINVGKRSNHHLLPQQEISEMLLKEATNGYRVVRLKGGDPFVFGRGGEELELLAGHEVPFEVVPGITSAVAVAAYQGIPVTHRDYTSSFHIVTGHPRANGESRIAYEALAAMDATLIFLMGVTALPEICSSLIKAGMDPSTPAAVLEKGTTARQRRIISTLAGLNSEASRAGIQAPAIIIVGKVCGLAKTLHWEDKRPLSGRQILLTRPRQLCSKTAVKLRELGAHVIELPTVATKANTDVSLLIESLNGIEADRENWLVFTSRIGVTMFFQILQEQEYDIRRIFYGKEIKVAVIGPGTRQELKKYGIIADLMPDTYYARDLGALLAEKAADRAKIYLARAQKGSPELLVPLKEKGLAYIDIPLYETQYQINEELQQKIIKMFQVGEIDWVTFTSASTVEGFAEALKGLDFGQVRAVSIGTETAAAAQKYGIQTTVSAAATIDSLISHLTELSAMTKRG